MVEYDERFNGRKLVGEKLTAAARFSELRFAKVSTALFSKETKKSVIRHRCPKMVTVHSIILFCVSTKTGVRVMILVSATMVF